MIVDRIAEALLAPEVAFCHLNWNVTPQEPNLFQLASCLMSRSSIGIKAIVFTAFPSGFQFGSTNVPVRTAFL
jgi:hypothetical protein